MQILIVALIVIIVVLCVRLKYAESRATKPDAGKTTEEKVADAIVASIWMSVDYLNRQVPLHSSVLSDTVLCAAFHRIISEVLTDYNLQNHFRKAYTEFLSRLSGGNQKQQRVAYELFEKTSAGFAKMGKKSFDDFEDFCSSAFFLAHDYYDFDDYYKRVEKIYMDEISKMVSVTINLLESAYPQRKVVNPIPREETYFLMEAANGMLVNVPESKLESWQRAQDEIRNGTYKVKEEEIQQMMDYFDRKAKEYEETKK